LNIFNSSYLWFKKIISVFSDIILPFCKAATEYAARRNASLTGYMKTPPSTKKAPALSD